MDTRGAIVMLSNYKTKNSDENNEFLMNYIIIYTKN